MYNVDQCGTHQLLYRKSPARSRAALYSSVAFRMSSKAVASIGKVLVYEVENLPIYVRLQAMAYIAYYRPLYFI